MPFYNAYIFSRLENKYDPEKPIYWLDAGKFDEKEMLYLYGTTQEKEAKETKKTLLEFAKQMGRWTSYLNGTLGIRYSTLVVSKEFLSQLLGEPIIEYGVHFPISECCQTLKDINYLYYQWNYKRSYSVTDYQNQVNIDMKAVKMELDEELAKGNKFEISTTIVSSQWALFNTPIKNNLDTPQKHLLTPPTETTQSTEEWINSIIKTP